MPVIPVRVQGLGSLQNGDKITAGFSFIVVVLFAWNPFKWFADKS